eukprot:3183955-Pyramimonas_sp.AAC.1
MSAPVSEDSGVLEIELRHAASIRPVVKSRMIYGGDLRAIGRSQLAPALSALNWHLQSASRLPCGALS